MEKPESVENLINAIEINNYGLIWSLMQQRKNHHFFKHKINKAENSYFEFIRGSAEWSEDFLVSPFINSDGYKFHEVFIDLTLKGSINEYNDLGKTFFSEPMDLNFSIRAYVQEDGWVGRENIRLLNQEQKALLAFHQKYEHELKRLNIKTIFETKFHNQEAFGFFTRIWKNIDNENDTMVNDTSLDYFHELGEAHRNIMYSVSCANMWGRYASHFSDKSYNMDGSTVYPYEPTFYDTRHIFYLESAVEEIYTFYERIAYTAYLSLEPTNFEAKALSYSKLFDRQTV